MVVKRHVRSTGVIKLIKSVGVLENADAIDNHHRSKSLTTFIAQMAGFLRWHESLYLRHG